MSQPEATLAPTVFIDYSLGNPPFVDPLVDPNTLVSSACTGATFGNNIVAPPGHAIPMIISKATASTIVLSDLTTDALAIFSEPNFWPLFGGRVLHIEAFP